jgi:hypothetical protein
MPYVSEFRLNEDVPKCELDNMSPISTSKKKERSLNVDESSSSLLMRKKFSRRCEDEHAWLECNNYLYLFFRYNFDELEDEIMWTLEESIDSYLRGVEGVPWHPSPDGQK